MKHNRDSMQNGVRNFGHRNFGHQGFSEFWSPTFLEFWSPAEFWSPSQKTEYWALEF